jgi:hypothetical protein
LSCAILPFRKAIDQILCQKAELKRGNFTDKPCGLEVSINWHCFFEFMLEKLDFMVLTNAKAALMFRRTSRDDLFLKGARSSAGRATDF